MATDSAVSTHIAEIIRGKMVWSGKASDTLDNISSSIKSALS
jgi:hypothetical protein